MPVAPTLAFQDTLSRFRNALRLLEKQEEHGPVDDEENFPSRLLQKIAEIGALSATLPVENGGLGLHDSPVGMEALSELLRLAGRLNLALGRCLEGHINVVRLVSLYGSAQQRAVLAEYLQHNILAGIWVTDGTPPVALVRSGNEIRLTGQKGFASAVRAVGVALITARTEHGDTVMVLVPVGEKARMGPGPGHLTGMSGSGTGSYDFTGVVVPSTNIIGKPGDYLRQPEFSAGAWRGSAVALGGMDHLVHLLLDELRGRGRASNPHQQVRIGEALILRETASMWVRRAAMAACNSHAEAGETVAIVNLARIAVEQAALALIPLVQRGLGVMAFVRGRPVERVMRDLATYLRQPAPDETLTEAAGWFTEHEWPKDMT
ncbi:acyl-CoA dehydrogenase family protein [Acetobacter sp. UBA5411]|uniref:acyl-CoA dehydrogenase family protein n=1 Tax=Acetobacter sp. UBA5411 TaxID=1945905 RepID=UPI0025BCE976|nr:acyl-CoA dehydrogenase family protein [Acetobacter sp. UBA5411]